MEIINVMKKAHEAAKNIMKFDHEYRSRIGVKTYKDALSFALKLAHKANKLLIDLAARGDKYAHMLRDCNHGYTFEIFGDKFLVNFFQARIGRSDCTYIGAKAYDKNACGWIANVKDYDTGIPHSNAYNAARHIIGGICQSYIFGIHHE